MSSSISNCTSRGGTSPFAAGRWPNPATQRGTMTAARLFATDLNRTADLQLQIKTDEGDTVTISLHEQMDLARVTYRYKSTGPDGAQKAKGSVTQLSVGENLSVQVQGSLNDQEQADVQALLDRVKRAVGQFFDGDGSVSLDALEGGGATDASLDSLSGYQLDFSRSETFDAIAMRLRQWTPAPATPIEPPATGASSPIANSSPPDPAPATAIDPVSSPPATEAANPAQNPTDAAQEVVERLFDMLHRQRLAAAA